MDTKFSLKLGNGETLNGFVTSAAEVDSIIQNTKTTPKFFDNKFDVNADNFKWVEENIEPKVQ